METWGRPERCIDDGNDADADDGAYDSGGAPMQSQQKKLPWPTHLLRVQLVVGDEAGRDGQARVQAKDVGLAGRLDLALELGVGRDGARRRGGGGGVCGAAREQGGRAAERHLSLFVLRALCPVDLRRAAAGVEVAVVIVGGGGGGEGGGGRA